MQPNQLDRQSTKVLTTFFTTKLSDSTHSLVPCVVALTKLTQGETFGTMEGIEVVKGIYSSVVLKNHPQSIRHTLYTLLDSLMSNCRPSLVRMGKEFIKGYCQFVEGEKDPRNLMISFGLVRIIVLEFDIEGCVEVNFHSLCLSRKKLSNLTGKIFVETGSLRYHLLLLPDHVHSTSRRSLRYYFTRSHRRFEKLSRFNSSVRSSRFTFVLG